MTSFYNVLTQQRSSAGLNRPHVCFRIPTTIERQQASCLRQWSVATARICTSRGETCARPQHLNSRITVHTAIQELQSQAEQFVVTLEDDAANDDAGLEETWDAKHQAQLQEQILKLKAEESRLSIAIDALYTKYFKELEVQVQYVSDAEHCTIESSPAMAAATTEQPSAPPPATASRPLEALRYESMTEAQFSDLGRSRPQAAAALMVAAEAAAGTEAWRAFQSQARTLKMQRSRVAREAQELEA
ncbi:hypothetical protein Vafri_21243, partial [Volvox africanus]